MLRQTESLINSMVVAPLALKIVESAFLVDRKQVRFPRSKKRRIRCKWAKQEKNWLAIPKRDVYKMGDMIICHPAVAMQIRKSIRAIPIDNNLSFYSLGIL